MKNVIVVATFCLAASLFAAPKSNGGKCPTCGKTLMQGAAHVCRAKGKNQTAATTRQSPSKAGSSKKTSIGKTPYDNLGEMFGVKIGSDVGKDFVPVKDRFCIYAFAPKTEYPPFVRFYVRATPKSRKVYEILAEANEELSAADAQRRWISFAKQVGFDYTKNEMTKSYQRVTLCRDSKCSRTATASARSPLESNNGKHVAYFELKDSEITGDALDELREGGDAILEEEWIEYALKFEKTKGRTAD